MMPKRSRLSRKSSHLRKKRHYVTKYFDVTPKNVGLTWRVIARTKDGAMKKFTKMMHRDYSWRPKVWEEFRDHNIRLAAVERWLSPVELRGEV